MKAAQYLGPKQIVLKNVPKPKIKPDEILMQTKSVGICGTDLHIYQGGMKVPIPLIQGHEFSGIVVEVGNRVKGLTVGDRIVAEHVIPCGKCDYCLQGKPNLCSQAKVIGLHLPGALAEYVAIPANLVYKIPKSLSFEEGALIEPLSIALYAIQGTCQLLNKKVAVVGQGPIGMLLDQLLKAAGAYVVGIDVLAPRLKFVKKKGWADKVINGKNSRDLARFKDSIDISFEVVGKEVTAQICIDLTRRDGQIFLIGVFEEPAKLNLMRVVKKELNLHGSWTCAFSFPESINLVAQGKVDLKSLITHRYTIDKVAQAFRDANNYSDNRIKTVINF